MTKRKQFTPEQEIALEWLSLPRKGGKTYEEIAALCGVTANGLYYWRQDAEFQKEIARRGALKIAERLPTSYEKALDAFDADPTNAAMLKEFNRMVGVGSEKVEIENTGDGRTLETDDLDALIAQHKAQKGA